MSETSAGTGVARAGRLRSWLCDPAVVVALLALLAVGPVVGRLTAQPASRYALTGALVDHGTVDLSRYGAVMGVDRATYGDELRSDKAPGQPFLGGPAYFAARVVGAEPAEQFRIRGNLGLWWVTLWSSMVPFAVLLALMLRVGAAVDPQGGFVAAAAVGLATILAPLSSQLFGHALAACLGYSAWVLVRGAGTGRLRLAAAGLLAGAATAVEYPVAMVLVIVGVAVALDDRRGALWYSMGAAPPILGLAAYHWVAFGAPWHTPQMYFSGEFDWAADAGSPFALPTVDGIVDLVAGPHGILIGSPVVLAGITVAVLHTRGTLPLKRDAAVGVAVVLAFAFFVAGWSSEWYSEVPGPRHMIPSLPFLVVPLASAWRRMPPWRARIVVTGAIGSALAAMATVAPFLVPSRGSPWRWYAQEIAGGRVNDTLWTLALGRFGWVLHAASVAGAGVLFVRRYWALAPSETTPVLAG